jgi:pimeloyl-ACP methyl ester carboxylesterase
MSDLRERELDVRGLRLHLRERGPEDGPACVLLHGWLDQGGSFDRLAPLLSARGVRTLALDLRGHGDSGWVGAGGFYHLVEYLADLDGALDALGLALAEGDAAHAGPSTSLSQRASQRVRLVGHSLGASISLLFAAARPERVAHVALLDGLPLAVRPGEVPGRLAEYLADLKKPRNRRTVGSLALAAERVQKASPLIRADAALHLAETGVSRDRDQADALAWKWDPWLRAHSPMPMVEEIFQDLQPSVTAPVLLLRAGTTWLPEEPELRLRLRGLKGPLTIGTIEGTSHHLHLEAPEAVAERLLAAWGQA